MFQFPDMEKMFKQAVGCVIGIVIGAVIVGILIGRYMFR